MGSITRHFRLPLVFLLCVAFFLSLLYFREARLEGVYKILSQYNLAYSRMLKIACRLDSISQEDLPNNNEEFEIFAHEQQLEITDPFREQSSFLFLRSNNRDTESWILISSGPDQNIETSLETQEYVLYNESTWTVSKGDIVFSHNYYPRHQLRSDYSSSREGEWMKSPYGWERVDPKTMLD